MLHPIGYSYIEWTTAHLWYNSHSTSTKFLWGVGKGQSLSLQEGASHTYAFKLK